MQLLPVFLGTFALEATTWSYQLEKPYIDEEMPKQQTQLFWHYLSLSSSGTSDTSDEVFKITPTLMPDALQPLMA